MTSLYDYIELAREQNHSADYINDLTQYITTLEAYGLPVIFSRKHLAHELRLSYNNLTSIINQRQTNYNTYKLRKKRGGYRWIMSPSPLLKDIQKIILCSILEKIPIHENAIAYRKKISIKDGAIKHVDKNIILHIDFYRFFDTITERRVYGIFKSIGYQTNLAVDLSKLLTVIPPDQYFNEIKDENIFTGRLCSKKEARLPQGAPTSPIISNLICRNLDTRLFKACQKLGNQYSRYADDITISSNDKSKLISMYTLKKIIAEEGFLINESKVCYYGSHIRQVVNGITVNKKLNPDKKLLSLIRKHLYFSKKYGPIQHQKYLENNEGIEPKTSYKDWLYGNICYINLVNPEKAKPLFKKFNEIPWLL